MPPIPQEYFAAKREQERKAGALRVEPPCSASSIPLAAKVKYVKSQKQSRDHTCHWLGCKVQVPPAMWGCIRHWKLLPYRLRQKIWAAYRPGQEVNLTPSLEYLKVAQEVSEWITDYLSK